MFSFTSAHFHQLLIRESESVVDCSEITEPHLVGIADVPLEGAQLDARSVGE
jgi:hypothetical protein